MILSLFFISLILSYISYRHSNLKFLSPTLWSSFMTCVFSAIYVLTFSTMKSDISGKTLLVITSGLLSSFLAEQLWLKIRINIQKGDNFKCNYKDFRFSFTEDKYIHINVYKILILTAVLLFVAIDRIKNMLSSVGGIGVILNVTQFASTMGRVRAEYVSDSFQSVYSSSTILTQFVYISEITAYVLVFIFLYNAIVCKKKSYYLLLPLIPDFLIRLSSTGRTSFVFMVISIVLSLFIILMKAGKPQEIIKISPKIIIGIVVFMGFFFWYGNLRRTGVQAYTTMNYLQMASCASIYAFDNFILNFHEIVSSFGTVTFRYIYNLFGIDNDTIYLFNSNFTVFSTLGLSANMYTSLRDPVLDYGIYGMFLYKFVSVSVMTVLLKRQLYKNVERMSFYWSYYFAFAAFVTAIYFPMSDKFSNLFINPSIAIRYFLYGLLLVSFYLRPKLIPKKL